MIRPSPKDVKERFRQIRQKHIERWDKANPEPERPRLAAITREIAQGKVTLDRVAAEDIDDDDEWGISMSHCSLLVETPSLKKWRAACAKRSADRARFLEELDEANDLYCDRVLFDHENGFLILRDFRNWKPGDKPKEKSDRE